MPSEETLKLVGSIIGAILIGATILKNWIKEQKANEDATKASTAAVPAVMHGLAQAGTPMPGLAIDSVNDLHLAVEKLTPAVIELRDEMREMRQDLRDDRMRQEGRQERGRR